jgi:ubiquinone/menaquinone biosynthesis C-methylase UbiE
VDQTHNPQGAQMAHPSMIPTLAAQAEAIWPQEQRLLARYGLPDAPQLLDVGCGSGEITARLAARHPAAEIVGVDLLPEMVAFARERHAATAPRARFEVGDALALRFADATFDLVVCRHLTQAVPSAERLASELVRVCRPGGWVHVLSEDYDMIHVETRAGDVDRLWHHVLRTFTKAVGTDERVGRKTWGILQRLGVEELQVDYVTVDPLRVPRATFATIMRSWRDGYAEDMARHASLPRRDVEQLFDAVVAAIEDPTRYAVWQVPIVSGRAPRRREGP